RRQYSLTPLLICVFFALGLMAQTQKSGAKMDGATLTDEQIAVYRAVLTYYKRDNGATLNLANVTVSLRDMPLRDEDCAKPSTMRGDDSSSVAHKLPANMAAGLNIVLVDPKQQRKRVEENDPQEVLKIRKR